MLQGRIIQVGQIISGKTQKGTDWQKQEYVMETSGKYPTKVAFSVMNEKIAEFNIQLGQFIEMDFNPRSRSFNGKWYTELTAWRVRNLGYDSQPQNNQPVYQQPIPQGYAPSVPPTTIYGQPVQQPQQPTAPIQPDTTSGLPF